MNRVNARIPRYRLAIAAVLSAGIAHASTEVASPDAEKLLTPADPGSLTVVWDELKVGGDKNFDAFIQGHPALVRSAANDAASGETRPAPNLLWVLGAGIIGLATVARRRSH